MTSNISFFWYAWCPDPAQVLEVNILIIGQMFLEHVHFKHSVATFVRQRPIGNRDGVDTTAQPLEFLTTQSANTELRTILKNALQIQNHNS